MYVHHRLALIYNLLDVLQRGQRSVGRSEAFRTWSRTSALPGNCAAKPQQSLDIREVTSSLRCASN